MDMNEIIKKFSDISDRNNFDLDRR